MLTFPRSNFARLTRVSRMMLLASLALAILTATLALPANQAAAAVTCRAQVTVQRGETLQKISAKYDLTWRELASANNITNPNRIFAGQVLCIPASVSTACRAQHTVQSGETLKRIGLKYNVTWQELARINNIKNPNRILAGQVLCIPAAPAPAPERIRFASGAIAGSAQGSVTFPDRKQYVLRALQGQQMTVEIISNGNKANFAVQGVTDGQPLKRLENEDRKWTGKLPANQDYLVTVASPGGASTYTLVITVVTP